MSLHSISSKLNYDHLADLLSYQPDMNQVVIQKITNQLPTIIFNTLSSISSPLKNPELLVQAKELSSQAAGSRNDKAELLEQAFTRYKNFIKLNKQQIDDQIVRDAALEAIFAGGDLLELLKTDSQRKALELTIKKIQIISTYSYPLAQMRLHKKLDALNIPQKHFALTSNPLGTTNVKDCIFLVIRNRDTYSTFAAHIDRNTDASSIEEAIQQSLPNTSTFDVYVIGAHLNQSDIQDYDLVNLPKVCHTLSKLKTSGYTFDARWCILRSDTPTDIVYYPLSNQFYQAVPTKELSSYRSCEILIYLDRENKKLLPYFIEQQQQETECALSLSPFVQKKLYGLIEKNGNCNKAKILEFISDELPTNLLTYVRFKSLTTAYSQAVSDVFVKLKELSPNSSDSSIQDAWKEELESNDNNLFYLFASSSEKNAQMISSTIARLPTNLN